MNTSKRRQLNANFYCKLSIKVAILANGLARCLPRDGLAVEV